MCPAQAPRCRSATDDHGSLTAPQRIKSRRNAGGEPPYQVSVNSLGYASIRDIRKPSATTQDSKPPGTPNGSSLHLSSQLGAIGRGQIGASPGYCTELATLEKTLFAFDPMSRIVPTTITRITANITAYSAISCPSCSDHSLQSTSFISIPPCHRRVAPAYCYATLCVPMPPYASCCY